MNSKLQSVETYIHEYENQALSIASEILQRDITKSSFNGIIGGKNATYDVDPLKYTNPLDYVNDWLKSHDQRYNDEIDCTYEKSSHRIHKLLSNDFLKNYIIQYLTRTYYRKHIKL